VTGPRSLAPPSSVERVLFFGKSMSRTRCTGGLVDAWRATGTDVRWLNMATARRWLGADRAIARARRTFDRFRPDVVFVFCRDLPAVLLEEFAQKVPVVLWIEEALEDIPEGHLDYYRTAHLLCLSNPNRIPLLEKAGVRRAEFLMSGFSPRYHRPSKARRVKRDLAFIGGPGRRGQRASLLSALAEEFDIEVFGLNWGAVRREFPNLKVHGAVDNRAYAKICATSRIVLGMNEINSDPRYFSNRSWLTLACRGFHLTHYVPGLEDVFENGKHLAWFRGRDDVFDLVRHYLAHPEEREAVRSAGHGLALARHQYKHRIATVRELIEPLLAGRAERSVVLEPVAPVRAAVPARVSPSPVRE